MKLITLKQAIVLKESINSNSYPTHDLIDVVDFCTIKPSKITALILAGGLGSWSLTDTPYSKANVGDCDNLLFNV